MIKQILSTTIILFSSYLSYGQLDSAKIDNLIVYGETFSFTIKEPKNWIGDIDSAANYNSNIIFCKDKKELENGGALIQVLAFAKQDENTNEDLEYDINTYKKDYEKLKQKDLSVTHKKYKCYPKLVFVKDEFYQYVVYINPGRKYKNGISISMNTSKREANTEELKAFLSIIESLWMIK